MKGFNHVVVSGQVTKIEPSQTNNGFQLCLLTVSNIESKKRCDSWEEIDHAIPVLFFGDKAQDIQENIRQGNIVMCEGIIKENKFTSQSGKEFSSLKINGVSCSKIGGDNKTTNAQASQNSNTEADIPF